MSQAEWVRWHVSGAVAPGEAVSGDMHVAEVGPNGALFAAIDGLGHGPPAAFAAERARRVLVSAPETPLDVLVHRCHQELRQTRGAVLGAGYLDRAGRLSWVGVGNVNAVLLPSGRRDRRSLASQPGVVGGTIPTLRIERFELLPGDMIVLATDGIRSAFGSGLSDRGSPESIVQEALRSWRNQMDDALVLAVIYLGGQT